MATLAEFLRHLLEEGEVVFRTPPTEGNSAEAEDCLRRAFATFRLEVAGPLLDFRPTIALAAAELLRQACWFLVHHGDPAEVLERRLTLPPPTSPAEHLSADLVLRYLPQVHRRAYSLAPTDPLAKLLAVVLRQWPLSGVTSEVIDAPLTPPDFGHPGLQLLYAERLAGKEKVEWLPSGAGLEFVELVYQEQGRGPAFLQLARREMRTQGTDDDGA